MQNKDIILSKLNNITTELNEIKLLLNDEEEIIE